jgi:pimeloyl-ACP methyl ester carboxylesterase
MKPAGHYVQVNDIKMYYETLGQGPPLLILHGGMVSSECWSGQLDPFARHFQVIVPDSRGHGRSTDSDQPFSYALMASDVIELLKYLQIQSTDLYGWSDGGIIGLHLAIHHPGVIKRQILVGTNFDVNGLIPAFRGWLSKPTESEESGCWSPEIVESYQRLSPQGPESWNRFFKKVITLWRTLPHYSEQEVSSITVPTLVVVGDQEQFVDINHTVKLFQLLERGELCIIPNADHRVFARRPELFNPVALEFLLPETR